MFGNRIVGAEKILFGKPSAQVSCDTADLRLKIDPAKLRIAARLRAEATPHPIDKTANAMI